MQNCPMVALIQWDWMRNSSTWIHVTGQTNCSFSKDARPRWSLLGSYKLHVPLLDKKNKVLDHHGRVHDYNICCALLNNLLTYKKSHMDLYSLFIRNFKLNWRSWLNLKLNLKSEKEVFASRNEKLRLIYRLVLQLWPFDLSGVGGCSLYSIFILIMEFPLTCALCSISLSWILCNL